MQFSSKKSLKKIIVSPDTPVSEALKVLSKGTKRIVLITDDEMRLIGILTDGDVRRAMMAGVALDKPVSDIMFTEPTTAPVSSSKEFLLDLLARLDLLHLPLVDESNRLVDLATLGALVQSPKMENPVVLMAGGLGTRLRPLTEDCPKPMLKVGDQPILEIILKEFARQGFSNFYLSVNYKAEMIKEHFGEGSQWGVNIQYLLEDKPLGTAGALSLFKERPSMPFIVMNGDLLTKIDFSTLIEFHAKQKSWATMCVRKYQYQVPFGVVQSKCNVLTAIEEKPLVDFYVNAGIYVLSPSALDHIPHNEAFDIPSLFEVLMEKDRTAAVFPMDDYWLDIGRMDDLQKARGEYHSIFSGSDDE